MSPSLIHGYDRLGAFLGRPGLSPGSVHDRAMRGSENIAEQ